MGGSSSAKADTIGQDGEEETEQWTILLASIFQWTRRMFAFSTAKAWWFARARRSRLPRQSPRTWPRRQVVVASFRDGANGANPVPRVEPPPSAPGVHREPTGLPGAQVTRDPQDRSQ